MTLANQIEQWNLAHPIGTIGTLRKDNGEVVDTKVRGQACEIGGQALAFFDQVAGGYLLDRFKPAPRQTIRSIVAEEAAAAGLSVEQVLGQCRMRPLVIARHKAIWRCWRELGMGPTQIARAFGERDHTSVLYAIKKVEAQKANVAP